MKRIVYIITLIGALVLTLSACGTGMGKIENYEWKMRYVMHVEDNNVVVDAACEDDSSHPEAKIIDMTLIAKDGKITITDNTGDKTYPGTYKVRQRTPGGTDYKVTIDGVEGYATVAMTTYSDGSEEPTLPINLGTYSIYFYAE